MNLTNNKIMPYLLPIITIIIISIAFCTKPAITGFVVAPEQQEDAELKIRISSTTIIPEGSIVEITANNQTYTLTIEEFIYKSGNKPEYIYSEIPEINYSGKGYRGDYSVDFDTLGLDAGSTPQVSIVYKNIIIFKNE